METLTAGEAAALARSMLKGDVDDLRGVWRFVIVQLLDDYSSVKRFRGLAAAADLFREPPGAMGDSRVDAALAALAEHLARRDGWPTPLWAARHLGPAIPWWFVSELESLQAMAIQQSPLSFRKRGVFIVHGALDRV
jgi:hypothetical protein